MRRTRSQMRAAQIAALVAEQEEHDRRVQAAVKHAAIARCDAVEQLYELLEIDPEPTSVRAGKGGPREVSSDKDEAKRSSRLVDAVVALIPNPTEWDRNRAVALQEHTPDALACEAESSCIDRSAADVLGSPGGRP